jgi:triacylglycerol lipase
MVAKHVAGRRRPIDDDESSPMAFYCSWQALLDPGRAVRFFEARPLPPFHAPTSAFHRGNAWWLAELSRLIYRRDAREAGRAANGPTRTGMLASVGLTERRFFDAGSVQAAIVTSNRDVHRRPFAVLVFRGTIGTVGSWLFNLDTVPVPWPGGGWVHRGFKRQFDRLWPAVAAELDELHRPWYYTGHSLGAALAVMAAACRPPQAVYAFGSPRIGSPGFVRSLRGLSIYRFSNHSDIVAALPFGFRHAGIPQPPAHMSGGGESSNAVPWHRRFTTPPAFLAQHAPVSYTRCVAPHHSAG